jgi:hypothetical protein
MKRAHPAPAKTMLRQSKKQNYDISPYRTSAVEEARSAHVIDIDLLDREVDGKCLAKELYLPNFINIYEYLCSIRIERS